MKHPPPREDLIVDPRAFLRSAAPGSPLWALVDAFDAATNGMTNPEAAERLAETEEDAFRPWKALVAALRAFYADDAASLLDRLDRIGDDAPPAVLKPLFRAWALAPDQDPAVELAEATASVAGLYRRVLADAHPLESLADQAEEALRQGMVDHFEALSGRVLRELHETGRADGPLLSLRYAARCLDLLEQEGSDDAGFFSALLKAVGRADGFVALGLALAEGDRKAAAAAFRGALSATGPRAFIDEAMAPVLSAAAEILEESPNAADKRKTRQSAKRRSACAGGQLDLFAGDAAV